MGFGTRQILTTAPQKSWSRRATTNMAMESSMATGEIDISTMSVAVTTDFVCVKQLLQDCKVTTDTCKMQWMHYNGTAILKTQSLTSNSVFRLPLSFSMYNLIPLILNTYTFYHGF